MRIVPTSLEITVVAILLMLGLTLLYEGTANQLTAVLILGALCFAVGVPILALAIRNVVWHRRMLRQSTLNQADLE